VDLRNLDDATFAEIEAAFDEYGVIVFRDQFLTPAEQVAFSRRFGPLDHFPYGLFNMADHPEIVILSNILQEGKPIGMNDAGRYWHSDMWTLDQPPRGSMLCAIEVPVEDKIALGDTYFASSTHAFDTLPHELKARVASLHGVFSTARYKKFVGHEKPDNVYLKEIVKAAAEQPDSEVTHPLVRKHPRTGKTCLFIVEGVIRTILELENAEANDLLDTLLAHTVRPEVTYRHRWRVGDVVMWDNYSAMHRAIGDFELPLRRLMHRTTLSASEMESSHDATTG
tara:strand:+ start:13587 stop:14432 length:846 start_codon:yes stop_codon:yes gene_type:complete